MAHPTTEGWFIQTQQDKDAVLKQLERLFAHPAFKSSKRCQTLLRYIVEGAIRAPDFRPKERTIGTEIFGREPDYDTNDDPVVRIAAGEIRRRIAQYYHEPGHEDEIEIRLPPGSYAAEFHLPRQHVPSPPLSRLPGGESGSKRNWLVYAAALLLLVLGSVFWGVGKKQKLMFQLASKPVPPSPSPVLNQFWKPLIASAEPVQICVGTWTTSSNSSKAPLRPGPVTAKAGFDVPDLIAMPEITASSKIIGFFAQAKKGYRLECSASTSIDDLTRGPGVFVGSFSNPWTMRVTSPLRFHFARDRKHRPVVLDRKDPSKEYWGVKGETPGSNQQYAVIARISSSLTGQTAVVIAGLSPSIGTILAGDFVTNAHDMEELAERLPKGWESKNIEALISVEPAGQGLGAHHIVAATAWQGNLPY